MANMIASESLKWFTILSSKLSHIRESAAPIVAPSGAPSDEPSGATSDAANSPTTTHILKLKTKTKEDEFHNAFRYFDSNADGKISSEELRALCFASIGECMSSEEAQDLINEFDGDGDGLLDIGDCMKLMEGDNGDEDNLLYKAFEVFEVEKGSGCITPKSLQRTLNRLGEAKSYEECVAMVRCFDLDDNGVIDFHEFQQMMT